MLKGVVRAERVEAPEDYIDEVLSRVKREYILKKYKFPADATWAGSEEFLTLLAIKMGKLRKRGEPDISIAARIVMYDWQRGRIPFFVSPPFGCKDEKETEEEVNVTKKEEPIESGNEEECDDADDEETTNPKVEAGRVMPVQQSFSDLICSVDFDDEDLALPDIPLEFEENIDELKAPPGLMKEEEEEEKIGDEVDDDEKIKSADNDDDNEEK